MLDNTRPHCPDGGPLLGQTGQATVSGSGSNLLHQRETCLENAGLNGPKGVLLIYKELLRRNQRVCPMSMVDRIIKALDKDV